MIKNSVWYLESECSRHMTGEAQLIFELIQYVGPKITFGDASQSIIVVKGKLIQGNIIIKYI